MRLCLKCPDTVSKLIYRMVFEPVNFRFDNHTLNIVLIILNYG